MGWSGPCARTMLVQPFQISPRSKTHQYLRNVPMHSVRGRREAGDDSGIWSDGLGIPWGIPDHYKALNPAANGLASTLCPWCVIGAHTDWINFLYYAEMKFQNLTRDRLQTIREELHGNSRFNAAKKQPCLKFSLPWMEAFVSCLVLTNVAHMSLITPEMGKT